MAGAGNDLPPGFRPAHGKRNPPAKSGPYYVMLRNGRLPPEPWPAGQTISGQTRWKWGDKPDPLDIVAVKDA